MMKTQQLNYKFWVNKISFRIEPTFSCENDSPEILNSFQKFDLLDQSFSHGDGDCVQLEGIVEGENSDLVIVMKFALDLTNHSVF